MNYFFLLFLGILGLLFGSFSSVLIHRFKSGEKGILTGRSHCGKCKHELGAFDLIPLFSWLFLGQKCRYCHTKIPGIYPILELSMAGIFMILGAYMTNIPLILSGDAGAIANLIFWLFIGFVSVIIVFYDILFLEIPDGFLLSSIGILITLLFFFSDSPIFAHFHRLSDTSILLDGFLGAWGIYTFFYILFLIPFLLYFIRKHRWKDVVLLFGYYFWLIPESIYYSVTGKEPPEEKEDEDFPGGWIGLWDLRIALFMGFAVGCKMAFLGLFLSYLVGSVISIGILAVRQNRKNTEVPFGPFLIAGLILSILFYDPIINLVFPTM